jgi:uncharacterized protein YehS (DUF1456 family)
MTHNDVLRSIRYMLNVSDKKLVEITELAGYLVTEPEIAAYLKKDDEEGYEACPDEVMAHFLNGLVIFKRGKQEGRPPQPIETPVTNNTVLKKLRVAFELKDTDLITLIEKSGLLKISKTELSAFFRKPDHRNYRECGDQYLRNVLKGLTP